MTEPIQRLDTSNDVAPGPVVVRYNLLAIVSFVSAFVVPIAAIVTGVLALSQLKTSQELGRGLSKAGVILGFVLTAVQIVFFTIWGILFFGAITGNEGFLTNL
jgi:hypothetical protein